MITHIATHTPKGEASRCIRVHPWLWLTVLTPAMLGCPKGDPRKVPDAAVVSIAPRAGIPLPSKDSALVEAGQAIARVMAASGALWPGWSPQALIVYWPHEPYGAVLVTEREAPADFAPVANGGEASGPRVYFRKGSLPGLIGNISLDYPVGTLQATAVTLDWRVAGTLDFAFHEDFHRFQREAFRDRKGDPFVTDSAVAHPEYLALRDVEIHLLRSALSTPVESRKPLLHQYFAVRRHRMSLVPPIVEVAERHWERIEGSGSWVGLLASSPLPTPAPGEIAGRVRDELLHDLVPVYHGGLSERVVYMRSRGTGAALIALLDDMGIDPRPDLERNRPIDETLERAIGSAPMSSDALISAAKRAAGYEALVATTRAWVDTLSPTTLKTEFLARPGFRVIIDAEGEPDGRGRVRFPTHNATGFMRAVDRTTSIFSSVEAFSVNETGFLLTARRVPLMLDRGNAARSRYVLVLGERPVVQRRPVGRRDQFRLTSSELDLQSDRATLLSETDSALHVLISPSTPP